MPPASEARSGGAMAAYTVFLLFAANILNYADRALLGIVVDPVKADLALTDTQISIVSGTAFVLFNLVVGIFIARWVDRGNRKRILLCGIALWSAATAATALAQGFWSLGLTRVLVGVGEATCFPVAMSMIADLFVPERRPRTISVFYSSTFIGIIAGSILAGVLAAHHGWRTMFAICGSAGFIAVAVMLVTMREPRRTSDGSIAIADANPGNMAQALGALLRLPGFKALSLGAALAAMGVSVLPVWAPAFLLRSHGVSLADVGALIGPAVGLGGISGSVLMGVMATWIARKRGGELHGLLVPVFALPIVAPLYALFLLSSSLSVALLSVGAINFLLASAMGPCIAVAVGVALPSMRAVASTLVLVASGVIGGAIAPLLVGALSDALAPSMGAESLRYALAPLAVSPLVASLFLWMSYRQVRGAMAAQPE